MNHLETVKTYYQYIIDGTLGINSTKNKNFKYFINRKGQITSDICIYASKEYIRIYNVNKDSKVLSYRPRDNDLISSFDIMFENEYEAELIIAVSYYSGYVKLMKYFYASNNIEILFEVKVHNKYINKILCLKPNAETIVTCGSDKYIGIIDRTNESGLRLEGHEHPIISMQYDVDRDILFSGDIKGTVKFWKLKERYCYRTINMFNKKLTDFIYISTHQLLMGGYDERIQIWKLDFTTFDEQINLNKIPDVETIKVTKVENIDNDNFNLMDIKLSIKEDCFGLINKNKEVQLYQIKSKESVNNLSKKGKKRNAVGKNIQRIPQFNDYFIKLNVKESHAMSFDFVCNFSDKNPVINISTCMSDNVIKTIKIDHNDRIVNICSNDSHRSRIIACYFDNHSNPITVSESEMLYWDKDVLEINQIIQWQYYRVNTGYTKQDYIDQLAAIIPAKSFNEKSLKANAVCYLRKWNYMLVGMKCGKCILINLEETYNHFKQLIDKPKNDNKSIVTSIEMLLKNKTEGPRVIISYLSGLFRIFHVKICNNSSLELQESTITLNPLKQGILSAKVAGDFIFFRLNNNKISLYQDGKWEKRYTELYAGNTSDGEISCMDIDCEVQRIICGNNNGSILCWEIAHGSCKKFYKGHNVPVTAIKFLNSKVEMCDSQLWISGDKMGKVIIGNIDTFEMVMTLEAYYNVDSTTSLDGQFLSVTSFNETKDGNMICIGYNDKTLRLYERTDEIYDQSAELLDERLEEEDDEYAVYIVGGGENAKINVLSRKTKDVTDNIERLIDYLEGNVKSNRIAALGLKDDLEYFEMIMDNISLPTLETVLGGIPYYLLKTLIKALSDSIYRFFYNHNLWVRCLMFLCILHWSAIRQTNEFNEEFRQLRSQVKLFEDYHSQILTMQGLTELLLRKYK